MPVYEYFCSTCGYSKDAILPIKDINEPLKEPCPTCGNQLSRSCGNRGGFRLGDRGQVTWAKGGYSTLLGDVWEAERKA